MSKVYNRAVKVNGTLTATNISANAIAFTDAQTFSQNVTFSADTNTTGNFTVDAQLYLGTDSISGAGVISRSTSLTAITTTGADALTIGDGLAGGQIKVMVMVADGGDGTLTPDNATGFSTATFNDVGDSLTLVWGGGGWIIVANNGCTIA